MSIDQHSSDDPEKPTVLAVIEAIHEQDFDRAYEMADAAIRQGVQQPALFNARAIWFQRGGRFAEALQDFVTARAYFPRDPGLLQSIGVCLYHLGRFQQAIAACDSAIAIAPDFAAPHFCKAQALMQLRETEAAQRALERTVALQPSHIDALNGLALTMMRKGRPQEAVSYAQRVLALDPQDPSAPVILANIDSEAGNIADAETRLRASLDNPRLEGEARHPAIGLLADLLDRQNRTEEAFEAYKALNEDRRRLYAQTYSVGRALENARGLSTYFETSPRWSAPRVPTPGPDAPAAHIFLLGFMRSGTTLLESVLASSSEVVATDEYEFLRESAATFLGSDAGMDRLASLDESGIAHWRAQYWQAVRNQGFEVKGKRFVDKVPLNSLKLPLIARLFPDAKVIFALRDPRDVVLSCFRIRFQVHTDAFEFLRLDECATYYSAVMRLVRLCRAKLPLTLVEHRYEDMIEDFDSSVRRICDFIGIAWNESMRDFSEGTRSVGIGSASAAQVRRGLYQGAVGQWRRYEKQMVPVLPILRPWVEAFGYPPD